MIRTQSDRQLSLAEFDWPFQSGLDEHNRWVKMSQCIPWDELAEAYYEGLSSTQGRPNKDARLVIGAVIIKHKLCLSDRETVAQIQAMPASAARRKHNCTVEREQPTAAAIFLSLTPAALSRRTSRILRTGNLFCATDDLLPG